MSFIRSLNSGVSGLRSFQTKMDVIGNNIANVETTGFKSSRVSFAEMVNQRLGRTDVQGDSVPQLNNQVGLGVRVASIDRDFTQGALQSTGRATDLAIEGDGYFVVSEGGQNLLTRAGNFVFNKDGFLVDQGGRFVQGYNADAQGNILAGGTTNNIQIDFENALPPRQTDEVSLAGNLDATTSSVQMIQAQNGFTDINGDVAALNTEINDLAQTTENFVAGDTIDFEVTLNDGTQETLNYVYAADDTLEDLIDAFNAQLNDVDDEGELALVDGLLVLRSSQLGDSQLQIDEIDVNGTGEINFPDMQIVQTGRTGVRTMSTTIYDDLGRAHTMVIEYTHIGDNEWEYSVSFPNGGEITDGEEGVIQFDESGRLDADNLFEVVFDPGGGANPMTFDVVMGDRADGSGFTQFAGSNTAKITGQDGHSQGQLVDVSIDGDGNVEGIYDNGESLILAQLSLAQVQNQNGLETMGGGLFRATSAAGEVFMDTAEAIAGTSISSGTLEGSNVDLAKEFTEMITSQRAYQSSARVISTSDEMLTEAVNLKR